MVSAAATRCGRGMRSTQCPLVVVYTFVVTFRVRRSRGEMYSGYGRLCVYVCVSFPRHIPTLLHGLGCKLGECYGVH